MQLLTIFFLSVEAVDNGHQAAYTLTSSNQAADKIGLLRI
jgi:hypothetical protein